MKLRCHTHITSSVSTIHSFHACTHVTSQHGLILSWMQSLMRRQPINVLLTINVTYSDAMHTIRIV